MREIACVLKSLEGLFVISGCLTHFGKKHGFTSLTKETYDDTVEALDKEILTAVEMMSLHLLFNCESNFCAKYVLGIMILLGDPKSKVEQIGYKRSLDKINGPDDNCVSYGGGVLEGELRAPPQPPSGF